MTRIGRGFLAAQPPADRKAIACEHRASAVPALAPSLNEPIESWHESQIPQHGEQFSPACPSVKERLQEKGQVHSDKWRK